MGRKRRGMMSEEFKQELAKDLGFYDVVKKEGWEGIRTKDAGNMVKRAIQIAEQHLVKQYQSGAQAQSTQPQMQTQPYKPAQQPYARVQSQTQPYGQEQAKTRVQASSQPYIQSQTPYAQVQPQVQAQSYAQSQPYGK